MTTTLTTRIAAACGAGVLLLGATACGSSEDGTTPTSAAAGSTDTGDTGAQNRTQGGQAPGVNGKVAAVTGSTAQVQGPDGQVAVTWNGSTTFTKQVSAALSQIEVGTCVMVQAEQADATNDDAAAEAPTEVTAATVRITEKGTEGTCTGGLGGGPGGGPGGDKGDGERPQLNGDGPGGGPVRTGFGGAFGEVTAVSATGFTVTSSVPPTTEERTVTVTVVDSTTYTTTGEGAASDVKVGSCLRADGETDSTGAVTARTVALAPATDGACGLVMRRGPGNGSANGPGAATQES